MSVSWYTFSVRLIFFFAREERPDEIALLQFLEQFAQIAAGLHLQLIADVVTSHSVFVLRENLNDLAVRFGRTE